MDTKVSFDFSNLRNALNEAAIIAITGVKGKITFANEKFCQISKYPREELIGQDHRILNSGYHPKSLFQLKSFCTVFSGKSEIEELFADLLFEAWLKEKNHPPSAPAPGSSA